MFTIEEIKAAHSKVKSGADFPAYIRNLKELGVSRYETFVWDGHTDYYGVNSYGASSEAKYEPLDIASSANPGQFQSDLKSHQEGSTEYATFCKECAQSGIDKWLVDVDGMTCTYYDSSGNEILLEKIPG